MTHPHPRNLEGVPLTLRTCTVDAGKRRRYLRAIGGVAQYGAESPDPAEVLAAAEIIRRDAARGLERA